MLFSVQTPAAGGTAFAQFAAAWCYDGNGYILNDTGTSLDVRIGASGSIQTLAAGGTLPIKLVYSMAELYVRRTDQSTIQVTVEAQVGTGSAGGGTTPAQAGAIAAQAAAAAVADAAQWGLLPTASALDNATALQAIADSGRRVKISAGTYLVGKYIKIPSGCWIEGERPGSVVLKRTNIEDEFLVNASANSEFASVDTDITLRNLTIDINGKGNDGTPYVPAAKGTGSGARGALTLFHAENVLLENLTFTNSEWNNFAVPAVYSMHLMHCAGVRIINAMFGGREATDIVLSGLQLGGNIKNLYIENMVGRTSDDLLAFIQAEWSFICRYTGGVIDGVTVNGLTKYDGGNTGRFVGIDQCSWADWADGNVVRDGTICRSGSSLYWQTTPTDGTLTCAGDAPDHTAGSGPTRGDGCKWTYIGPSTPGDDGLGSQLRNITLKNLRNEQYKSGIVAAYSYLNATYGVEAVYPGSAGKARIKGLVLDGVTWAPLTDGVSTPSILALCAHYCDDVTIRNLCITGDYPSAVVSVSGGAPYNSTVPSYVGRLSIEDSKINWGGNPAMVTLVGTGSTIDNLVFKNVRLKQTATGYGSLLSIGVGSLFGTFSVEGGSWEAVDWALEAAYPWTIRFIATGLRFIGYKRVFLTNDGQTLDATLIGCDIGSSGTGTTLFWGDGSTSVIRARLIGCVKRDGTALSYGNVTLVTNDCVQI